MKKIKYIIILVIVIIIGIGLMIFFINKNQDESNQTYEHSEEIEEIIESKKDEVNILKNRDDFYTIENCINRYLNYLAIGDKEAIIQILDEEYKNQKGITDENVMTQLNNTGKHNIFKAKKIYIKEKSIEEKEYYVSGKIREDQINEHGEESDFTITVKTYQDIYSIIPECNYFESETDI